MDVKDVARVESRDGFANFVEALSEEWRESNRVEARQQTSANEPATLDWENPTLDRFLEAMAAYVRDAEFTDPLSWRTFAEILAAAKVYE